MSLPREKATQLADLPHKFAGEASLGCDICGQPEFEPRHVEWERAMDQETPASLPRETGV